MCMARLSVRIRSRLFDSILAQELGYFDCTKTGAGGARAALACVLLSCISALWPCYEHAVHCKPTDVSAAARRRRDHQPAVGGHHDRVRADLPQPERARPWLLQSSVTSPCLPRCLIALSTASDADPVS